MNTIDIEKLNQLISRTDISGNDKVRWLTDFIDGRELQLIQDEFYSDEEVLEHLNHLIMMKSSTLDTFTDEDGMITMKWFEQFKKK
jgi:hypothetical protein